MSFPNKLGMHTGHLYVSVDMSHLDASILEDGHLPEASLPEEGSLQQDGQPAALRSSWVLHGHRSTGQAAPRAQSPDRGRADTLKWPTLSSTHW